MFKTLSYRFLAVLAIAAVFAACGKYKEGPVVSLIPRSERIANKWMVSQVLNGKIDSTSSYSDWIFEFTPKGTVITQVKGVKFLGIWQLNNSNRDFDLFYDNHLLPDSRNQILMLKEKEFHFRNRQTNTEFRLKPL